MCCAAEKGGDSCRVERSNAGRDIDSRVVSDDEQALGGGWPRRRAWRYLSLCPDRRCRGHDQPAWRILTARPLTCQYDGDPSRSGYGAGVAVARR